LRPWSHDTSELIAQENEHDLSDNGSLATFLIPEECRREERAKPTTKEKR
jgi:hypothetical protein